MTPDSSRTPGTPPAGEPVTTSEEFGRRMHALNQRGELLPPSTPPAAVPGQVIPPPTEADLSIDLAVGYRTVDGWCPPGEGVDAERVLALLRRLAAAESALAAERAAAGRLRERVAELGAALQPLAQAKSWDGTDRDGVPLGAFVVSVKDVRRAAFLLAAPEPGR